MIALRNVREAFSFRRGRESMAWEGPGEVRLDLIREAIDREIKRREKAPKGFTRDT